MGHCHDVCNVWSHTNDLFSMPFKDILIKNLVYNVTDMLKTIPIDDFQRCYQKWEQCLHRCVAAQGNILKGIILMFEKKTFGK
jgi:hypothetical protein